MGGAIKLLREKRTEIFKTTPQTTPILCYMCNLDAYSKQSQVWLISTYNKAIGLDGLRPLF